MKEKSRFKKIFLSSSSAIVLKCISFICTFIITRLIIKTYGSEINGMIGSITQFLGFVTLLEGGIGGIARAALFKPLAKKDHLQISRIITYTNRFFRIIAFVFVLYVLGVAFIFPSFATNNDYFFSFTLVLILALSSFCEYFFGMSYSVLINADQKNYIGNYLTFLTTILSFIISIILIKLNFGIHLVKLSCSAILILKPIFLSLYCRKKYNIKNVKINKNENVLPNKWSGLGVHIAYYLHRNTDTFLITIFLSLSVVSVYSVYNMIVGGILTIAECLTLGIESAFGNMYANKEYDNLKQKFKLFVFYYQLLCTILFSSTVVLIVPFVKVYTSGITDVNYIQPVLAALLVIAEFSYCLRVPYNNLMVATDSFDKVKLGAFYEAAINIAVSIFLIRCIGLIGVVIGTIVAMLYRLIHYLRFFKTHELSLEYDWFLKISLSSTLIMSLFVGISFIFDFSVNSYIEWIFLAICVVAVIAITSGVVYFIFCKKDLKLFISYAYNKIRGKKNV